MTLAQDARDFRALTDEQYADVLNGRKTAAEAVAEARAERERKAAERKAREYSSAESAAGSALLFHVNPRGGSSGPGIDPQRAEEVAQTITGPELLSMLIDAAKRGAERAKQDASLYRHHLIHGVRQVAEAADSLALHRFVERFEKEAAR